jgi:hypothetical protein
MFTMWTMLFFLWLLRGIRSGDRAEFVVAGMFLGLAALTRPTIALFPAVVGVYLWARRGYGFRRAFGVGTVLVVTLVLVLSPWIVRNYVHFGKFIPLTKASGNPFLTGTYLHHDVWKEGKDPEFPDYPKGWKKVPGDQLATDDLLFAIGKQRFREQWAADPGAMLKWYTVGKFLEFWWNGTFDWQDLLKEWKAELLFLHRGLLVLGLAGAVYALWRRVEFAPLLVMWIGYFTALHMVYVTFPRYATPLLPVVFLFAGMMLTAPLEAVKRRQGMGEKYF